MSLVAFLGGLCIMQAFFLTAGYPINSLSLFLSIGLLLVAIFGFIPMSVRVFRFFNPTLLVNAYAVPDFLEWASRASIRGGRSEDPNFQNHYGDEAQKRLTIINNAVDIVCGDPETWKSSYLEVLISILYLTTRYTELKREIPSESFWHRRYLGHRSWFSADTSEADIAAQHLRRLQPRERRNNNWVEDSTKLQIYQIFECAYENKEFSKMYNISVQIQELFAVLARHGAINEVRLCWQGILRPALEKTKTLSAPGRHPEESFLIGTIDAQAACLPIIFQSYNEYLAKILGRDSLEKLYTSKTISDVIETPVAASLIPRIQKEFSEFLVDKLIEGRDASPNWFKKQRVARVLGEDIKEHASILLELLEDLHQVIKVMPSEERSTMCNVAAFRGLEASKKGEYLLRLFEQVSSEIEQNWRVHDTPKPCIGVQDFGETNAGAREKFLRLIAKTGFAWDFRGWNEADLPDYFGQTYWLVGNECYISLERGDVKKFDELFPIFFAMGIYAADAFRAQLDSDKAHRNLIGFRDLFLDMMAISGYAAAHTEIQGHSFWEVVKKNWSVTIDEYYGPEASYALMKTAIELDKGVMGAMSARSVARSSWSQQFARYMRENGLVGGSDWIFTGSINSGSTNPFLRAIERTSSVHPNPEEFFVARLAVERQEETSQDLTPQVKNFIREWGK